jgi:uncharacterized membrane protein
MVTNRSSKFVSALIGAASLTLLVGAARDCPAQPYRPVYGGPTYAVLDYSFIPAPHVNNAGTAIGTVYLDDEFTFATVFLEDVMARGVRWDGSGAPPFEFDAQMDADGSGVSIATTINDAGIIVGRKHVYSDDGLVFLGDRPVRWDAAGEATELGNLGTYSDGFAYNTQPRAINAAGDAVGRAEKYDAAHEFVGRRAVRWDASSTAAVELAIPAAYVDGDHSSNAYDINDAGMVIGSAGPGRFDDAPRPVRWDEAGIPTVLDSIGSDPNGNPQGTAFAINNAGTAVGRGRKWDASGNDIGGRAIRWDADGMAATELRGLGARADGYEYSSADGGINDAGDIVGWAEKYDEFGLYLGQRAVRWDAGTTLPIELDHLDYTNGFAVAMNNAGAAVGQFLNDINTGFPAFAAYWRPDGTAVDLNTLIDPDSGWQLWAASDISDTGWITGYGYFDPDGPGGEQPYTRLFLLQIPTLPGDYNNNGVVEQADLDLVLLNWGADAATPPAAWINDLPVGVIDQAELDGVLLNWGQVGGALAAAAGAAAVPEPNGVLLALVLIVGLSFSRTSFSSYC